MDQAWLTLAIAWGTILTIGCVGHLLIYRLLLALARRTHSELLIPLVRRAYRPAQWLGITIFISRAYCGIKGPDECPQRVCGVGPAL